jgi:hypothetical protein
MDIKMIAAAGLCCTGLVLILFWLKLRRLEKAILAIPNHFAALSLADGLILKSLIDFRNEALSDGEQAYEVKSLRSLQ